MDQGHGGGGDDGGLGQWDPNTFAGGWNNGQFQDFDGDSFLADEFFPPSNSNLWPASAPSTSPYGQDSSSLSQMFYPAPPAGNGPQQNAQSRFAPAGVPQGSEAPTFSQAPGHAVQGDFHNHPAPSNSQANNYIQSQPHPQWQQQQQAPKQQPQQGMPAMPVQAPANNNNNTATAAFQNPLASSQTMGLQNQGLSRGMSPFQHGQNPIGVTGRAVYQPPAHQAHRSPAPAGYSQFVPVQNGHSQGRNQVAQAPPHQAVGSRAIQPQPQQQQAMHQVQVQQMPPAPHQTAQQQPVQHPGQQPGQQSTPNLPPNLPPQYVQNPGAQKASIPFTAGPQAAKSWVSQAGVQQLRPATQSPEPSIVIKSAQVGQGPAASTAPKSKPAGPFTSSHFWVDNQLQQAQGRQGATWPGVPNLYMGQQPATLQKGTPTRRYVTLSTKGGKPPMFPAHPQAWAPAESLGNHAMAYQNATSDVDKQRADIRLELEMKRADNGKPVLNPQDGHAGKSMHTDTDCHLQQRSRVTGTRNWAQRCVTRPA